MGNITIAIDNIASAQESIANKIYWLTDAAAEVPETETFSLIVNDYVIQLRETIAELRELESSISKDSEKIGGSGA